MVKTLLALSMAASIALVTTGCGGDGANDSKPKEEVQKPAALKITTIVPGEIASGYRATIKLATNRTNAEIEYTLEITPQEARDYFRVEGSNLIFTAPEYNPQNNRFTVTVTAKDTKTNESAQKTLVFKVKAPEQTASKIVIPVGDKNLKKEGNEIVDLSGLRWLNEAIVASNFAEAQTACTNKGYRLPRRDELLNVLDYSKVSPDTKVNMLEDEFSYQYNESWAAKVDKHYLTVNFVSGAEDFNRTAQTEVETLCVRGASATAHTFVKDANVTSTITGDTYDTYRDSDTGLRWVQLDSFHAALTPADANKSASQYCESLGDGFRLATINELRTLVDYGKNRVASRDLVPAKVDWIWSDTEYDKTDKKQNYILFINNKEKPELKDIPYVHSEEVAVTGFVGCVNDSGKKE